MSHLISVALSVQDFLLHGAYALCSQLSLCTPLSSLMSGLWTGLLDMLLLLLAMSYLLPTAL